MRLFHKQLDIFSLKMDVYSQLTGIIFFVILLTEPSNSDVIFGKYRISKITQWNYGFPLDFFYISGVKKCFMECQKDPMCQSTVYSTYNRGCQTNRLAVLPGTLQNSTDPAAQQYIYIGKVDQSVSTIRQSCTYNSDCLDLNSECRDSICKCFHGYSHKSDIYTCVTNCTAYGHTFQAELGHVIGGYNERVVYNSTDFNCASVCLYATFTCRSYEFDRSTSTCYVHKVTAATVPSVQDINYNLYTRDCA